MAKEDVSLLLRARLLVLGLLQAKENMDAHVETLPDLKGQGKQGRWSEFCHFYSGPGLLAELSLNATLKESEKHETKPQTAFLSTFYREHELF